MAQIIYMGLWLTILSFIFLKHPFFAGFFQTTEQHLTAYFVLFIYSALFNGFNVRDDGFGVFKGLGQNRDFLKVMLIIAAVQACIVNAGLVPFLGWIGKMFSCVPFGISGWCIVIVLAATMIPVDLLRKSVVRR